MINLNWNEIDRIAQLALEEDLGAVGDITTEATIPEVVEGKTFLVAKAAGVIAGLPVIERVFAMVDPAVTCQFAVEDGERIQSGQHLGSVLGSMKSILKGERTALNILQRLSGIATKTRRFVDAVSGTNATILDTRKTTPLLRSLEKYAVRVGGGQNHRFGLYDMVMIKDNHIDAAGGISKAIQSCLDWMKTKDFDARIEVETRTLDEVREALTFPIHRIMLDNMDLEMMRDAVDIIKHAVEVEASGNVSLENVRLVAGTGVDFISVGALTHSVTALDISLINEGT